MADIYKTLAEIFCKYPPENKQLGTIGKSRLTRLWHSFKILLWGTRHQVFKTHNGIAYFVVFDVLGDEYFFRTIKILDDNVTPTEITQIYMMEAYIPTVMEYQRSLSCVYRYF